MEFNKELEEITHNEPPNTQVIRRQRSDVYHLLVELNREYESLCKRNRVAISDASKNAFRLQGFKHIDLWVDGRPYPMDPTWKSTPPFKDVTSLLHFFGNGYRGGLLGYTQSLDAHNNILKFERDVLERENVNLKYIIEQYKAKLCNSNETISTLKK